MLRYNQKYNWQISSFVIFIISILFCENINSQSGNAKSLEIGNKWFYYHDDTVFEDYYLTEEVTGDTIINGTTYAIITRQNGIVNYSYERADSVRIYRFWTNVSAERPLVDFSLNVGDSLTWYLVISKDSIFIWENWLTEICMYYNDFLSFSTNCYTEWIGLTAVEAGGIALNDYTLKLEAAYIEGNVYGDTTLLSYNEQSEILPNEFILFQNYPNPFNPTTNIIFGIPTSGIVKVRIYDLLGRLMELNNYGYKNAGKHSVNFDGSNYTSGVYFYQIQYESKIKTKKMLLLK